MAGENWVRVASESDFEGTALVTADAGDEAVVVCKIAGRYYAIEDRCSHDDGPLGYGELHDSTIQCPRHGAKFDVASGGALSMPAVTGIRTFEVKVENGEVFVRLDEP
ncbi:MAG: non-heme iron oxygenase ferredoxin subunit [Acidobacteria bacterium]|nr:non-heme iron oxygenase ferredoxin subunit [Acidobacteriota bacterium]